MTTPVTVPRTPVIPGAPRSTQILQRPSNLAVRNLFTLFSIEAEKAHLSPQTLPSTVRSLPPVREMRHAPQSITNGVAFD